MSCSTCVWFVSDHPETKMLIKEYRIPLPLTVEEYRIAQLFMIAVSLSLYYICKENYGITYTLGTLISTRS